MIGLEWGSIGTYVENIGKKWKKSDMIPGRTMALLNTNGSWNIWEKTKCHCGAEEKKYLPDNGLCLPLLWKSRYQRIRKNKTLPRFGTRVEKDMKHENHKRLYN